MKSLSSRKMSPKTPRKRSRISYEQLENRQLLAVSAVFSSGTLTVSLSAANDAAFLQVDGGGKIDVGTSSGSSNVYNGTDSVSRIVVQDTHGAGEQAITFYGVNPFNLENGLSITAVESVFLNQAINVGSTSAALSLTQTMSIFVNAAISTSGGEIELSADNRIEINSRLNSNGGNVSFQADANADGYGEFIISQEFMNDWLEKTKLSASDGRGNNLFGSAVALSGDGNTAIIGASDATVGMVGSAGAAYIFSRSGSTWHQRAKLTATDFAYQAFFGSSVAINGEGNRVIVGSTGSNGRNNGEGAAYIFENMAGVWSEQAKLYANDGVSGAKFGISVGLSSDGDTAVIGASQDWSGWNQNYGSAYVFARSNGLWSEQAKVFASDRAPDDSFGASVSISGDGATICVGSPRDDYDGHFDIGSAYVFSRLVTTWSQTAKLTFNGGTSGDFFGSSVAVSGDGRTAIVIANGDDIGVTPDKGSATVFYHTNGGWNFQQFLTASNGVDADRFSDSVSISHDGDTAVFGVSKHNYNGVTDRGAAYIFVRAAGFWREHSQVAASDGANRDFFGSAVAVDRTGDTIIIGAYQGDGGIINQGAAYVYTSLAGGSVVTGNGSFSLQTGIANLQGKIFSKGSVSIAPTSPDRSIDLGTKISGKLCLLGEELDLIITPNLFISTGPEAAITLSREIERIENTNVWLTSGIELAISGGPIKTAGGRLFLSTSGVVKPINSGIDAFASSCTLGIGSKIAFVIDGSTADTLHTRFSIAGEVNLGGAELLLSGFYNFSESDVLTIVTGTNLVGTFGGLSNGDLITFSGQTLQVFYTQTSVNLRLAPKVRVTGPVGPISENNSGTQTVHFTVSLSAASTETVKVNYATMVSGYANAATPVNDFTPVSGLIEFAPGETTKSIPVLVRGDRSIELDELFGLLITNPVNGQLGVDLADLIITDDDSWSYPQEIDFGTEVSPVKSGAVALGALPFTSAKGLGWSAGLNNLQVVDRGLGSAGLRDIALTSNSSFAFNVPNGTYILRLTFGDAIKAHEQMRVTVEGSSKPLINTAVNQFITRIFTTTVSDGRLDLSFADMGGADPQVAIAGIAFGRR